MENMEDSLYRVLPLVLMILFAWIFSYLSKRTKKQGPAASTQPEREPQDEFMDLLSDTAGGERRAETPQAWTPGGPADTATWKPQRYPGGPVVTPAPIKPKWWGA
jgi:hypothetical protein